MTLLPPKSWKIVNSHQDKEASLFVTVLCVFGLRLTGGWYPPSLSMKHGLLSNRYSPNSDNLILDVGTPIKQARSL